MTTSRLPIAVLLLALAGCGGVVPLTREADKTTVCVDVRWTPQVRIADVCKAAGALIDTAGACLFQGRTIITRKPNNFADDGALIALGHELYHAMGAMHD